MQLAKTGRRILRFSPSRLAQLRKDAGLTREEVAVALRKSYGTIAFYERGEVTPPVPMIEELAHLFGVTPGDFFEAEDR